MTFVDINVRVETDPNRIISTPKMAKAMVEEILRKDPRFRTCAMEVSLPASDEFLEWNDMGAQRHNVFENPQQS